MSAAQKIFLSEKDDALRVSIAEQLEFNGEFACVDGTENDVVLALLGVSDNEDADAACTTLRANGIKAPIILLGHAESDVADDFLPKPFRFSQLMASLRAQLRQYEKGEDGTKLGLLEFRPSEKALIDQNGERAHLTEKETAILRYLLRAEGATIGRNELLTEVWGYNSGVTTHTLETHVYRLRKKLGQNANGEEILITETGGYRLAQ